MAGRRFTRNLLFNLAVLESLPPLSFPSICLYSYSLDSKSFVLKYNYLVCCSSSSRYSFSSMEFLTKLERLDFGCNELEELVSQFQSIPCAQHLNKNICILYTLVAGALYFNYSLWIVH